MWVECLGVVHLWHSFHRRSEASSLVFTVHFVWRENLSYLLLSFIAQVVSFQRILLCLPPLTIMARLLSQPAVPWAALIPRHKLRLAVLQGLTLLPRKSCLWLTYFYHDFTTPSFLRSPWKSKSFYMLVLVGEQWMNLGYCSFFLRFLKGALGFLIRWAHWPGALWCCVCPNLHLCYLSRPVDSFKSG